MLSLAIAVLALVAIEFVIVPVVRLALVFPSVWEISTWQMESAQARAEAMKNADTEDSP